MNTSLKTMSHTMDSIKRYEHGLETCLCSSTVLGQNRSLIPSTHAGWSQLPVTPAPGNRNLLASVSICFADERQPAEVKDCNVKQLETRISVLSFLLKWAELSLG